MPSSCVTCCRQSVHNISNVLFTVLSWAYDKNQQLQSHLSAVGSRRFLNTVTIKSNENKNFQMLIDLTLPLFVFTVLIHRFLLLFSIKQYCNCYPNLFLNLLNLYTTFVVKQTQTGGISSANMCELQLGIVIRCSQKETLLGPEIKPLKTGESVVLYPILPTMVCSLFEKPCSNCRF